MKKTVITLLFSIMLGGVLFAQDKSSVKFDRKEHNFGTIKEEIGAVTTQFEFTNTGKTPIIIQRVATSCGCTTPSYTREPVLPGKKGVVSAKYSTTGRPGKFNKSITVYTNVPDTIYTLNIKGSVTPRVRQGSMGEIIKK